MLYSLGETYELFKEAYPDHPVGRAKFIALRPKHCILPGGVGTHSICVCVTHQNVELILNALHLDELDDSGIGWTSKDIMKRMVCASPTESCFTGIVASVLPTNAYEGTNAAISIFLMFKWKLLLHTVANSHINRSHWCRF